MNKVGTTLVVSGAIVLLGVLLFNPTYNLLRNTSSRIAIDTKDFVENEDSIVYANEELITDFPDVPVYPASKIMQSGEVNDNDNYGYFATWQTNTRSMPSVTKFFVDEAKKRNWQILHTPDTTGKTGDEYLKAVVNGREISVYVERESDESFIEVRVNIPPAPAN